MEAPSVISFVGPPEARPQEADTTEAGGAGVADSQSIAGSGPPEAHPAAAASHEAVAEAVESLRQAVHQELQRCAGVLFSHDRAIAEIGERLGGIGARLEAAEARPAPAPNDLYEQALGHVLEQLESIEGRLRLLDASRDGSPGEAVEARVGELETVVPVVQALRHRVREVEDAFAAELAALREQAGAAPEPGGEDDLAVRVDAHDRRLGALEKLPDDIAALGRIVRRELEALTTDVEAKDQILRRALQKEIERLQAAVDDRDDGARDTAQRIELLERRLRGAVQTHDDAASAVTRRLEAMESRLVSVDGLADDIDTLRAAARRELERLRAATQAHDQALAESVKRFAALDGRLTRLDALPGEVHSLRAGLRQEGDRAAVAVRSIEERMGELSDKAFRQLRQVADVVAPLEERVNALTVELERSQQTVRALEVSVAEALERLDESRLVPGSPAPPGPDGGEGATGPAAGPDGSGVEPPAAGG